MDSLDDDLDVGIFQVETSSKKKDGPCHHKIDAVALATYIYPTNLPIRDYQYNIVYRSFFHNIVVALPTGLGKTFIASTVMLNFLRWFPEAKVIFMAPTKPLVAQQIKACCGITGIPPEKVAILLDKTRRNRAAIWDEKQVFFTTPQVVENDLATGIVDPKSVVLLVIDEAHRAKGNYAYNNVVKFLDRFNPAYRVLALTATPASDVEGVQEIVDNLLVSKIEVRTEKSIDIYKYLKRKLIDRVTVGQSEEIRHAVDLLTEAVKPILEQANQRNIYDVRDPAYINAFTAMTAQKKIVMNRLIPEGLKWLNFFILQLLAVVGQGLRRLNIYGIRSFYAYFKEKYTEFTTKFNSKKSKNNMAAKFYFHDSIKKLVDFCEKSVADKQFLGHPKLEIVISELESFFQNTSNQDSRVIIFTEFRELALDIVRAIEQRDSALKPHIFIGQAKEREKFDEEKFAAKGKKGKKKDVEPQPPSSSERPTSSEEAQMTGMNQKVQKELIRKFKAGEYNILVATSIGEEGLDIGEVDLIVCYDSTSSPIKNIQRMGRTGRNRDGKVLLLFAGNEETKFDKAMGGYEYIQQHIMNGNMINLHDQRRIIPHRFNPVVNEQFIEIPDENVQIKNEDDEDEIIKIAMKYMSGTKKGKSKAKSKKIEKRFFMPDDVETGFQSVSDMLKNPEGPSKKRQKVEESEDELISDDILAKSNESSFQKVSSSPVVPPPSVAKKLKQPTLETVPGLPPKQATKMPGTSLGVKKRPPNVINQLKAAQSLKLPESPAAGKENTPVEAHVSDDDFDFDDDDDEILALAERTSSMNTQPKPSQEALYPNDFQNQEGILTSEQTCDLYMSYYTPVNASDLDNIYDPQDSPACDSIRHSTTSTNLLHSKAFMSKLSDKESKTLIHTYQSALSASHDLPDFVDFD